MVVGPKLRKEGNIRPSSPRREAPYSEFPLNMFNRARVGKTELNRIRSPQLQIFLLGRVPDQLIHASLAQQLHGHAPFPTKAHFFPRSLKPQRNHPPRSHGHLERLASRLPVQSVARVPLGQGSTEGHDGQAEEGAEVMCSSLGWQVGGPWEWGAEAALLRLVAGRNLTPVDHDRVREGRQPHPSSCCQI